MVVCCQNKLLMCCCTLHSSPKIKRHLDWQQLLDSCQSSCQLSLNPLSSGSLPLKQNHRLEDDLLASDEISVCFVWSLSSCLLRDWWWVHSVHKAAYFEHFTSLNTQKTTTWRNFAVNFSWDVFRSCHLSQWNRWFIATSELWSITITQTPCQISLQFVLQIELPWQIVPVIIGEINFIFEILNNNRPG